jgi:hypothetical protein
VVVASGQQRLARRRAQRVVWKLLYFRPPAASFSASASGRDRRRRSTTRTRHRR